MDSSEGRAEEPPQSMTDRRASTSFNNVVRQVQYLLNYNRLLIHEINHNHEANLPEGLTRNVLLTRHLNISIDKVVDLYATLSSDFSEVFENFQEVNSDLSNPVAPRPGIAGQHSHKKFIAARRPALIDFLAKLVGLGLCGA